jgi:hypothetical protein
LELDLELDSEENGEVKEEKEGEEKGHGGVWIIRSVFEEGGEVEAGFNGDEEEGEDEGQVLCVQM